MIRQRWRHTNRKHFHLLPAVSNVPLVCNIGHFHIRSETIFTTFWYGMKMDHRSLIKLSKNGLQLHTVIRLTMRCAKTAGGLHTQLCSEIGEVKSGEVLFELENPRWLVMVLSRVSSLALTKWGSASVEERCWAALVLLKGTACFSLHLPPSLSLSHPSSLSVSLSFHNTSPSKIIKVWVSSARSKDYFPFRTDIFRLLSSREIMSDLFVSL